MHSLAGTKDKVEEHFSWVVGSNFPLLVSFIECFLDYLNFLCKQWVTNFPNFGTTTTKYVIDSFSFVLMGFHVNYLYIFLNHYFIVWRILK